MTNINDKLPQIDDEYINYAEVFQNVDKFKQIMCWYGCAIREVRT